MDGLTMLGSLERAPTFPHHDRACFLRGWEDSPFGWFHVISFQKAPSLSAVASLAQDKMGCEID